MKIDMFTHIMPQRYFDEFIKMPAPKNLKRASSTPSMVDLNARFKIMDEFGDYAQVISLSSPPLEVFAAPDKSPQLARMANDGMAEIVQKHPSRFPGFVATLPMNNIEESIKETERALSQLGAKGVMLYTNVAGKALDEPEFLPIFEGVARHDAVIWLHPARSANFADYTSLKKSRYEIWWAIGWPYETGAAMAHIVFARMFDRFPELKIITHHLGGVIPYFEGRIAQLDDLGVRTADEDYAPLLRSLKKRPLDYFRMFYGDIALGGSAASIRCGLEFFGPGHVVFGSDAPFCPTPGQWIRDAIRALESLDLDTKVKDQIYYGNAERLLKLAPQSQRAGSSR
jgi:predicted TIM-barrel fold metal-dependent hydrolase